ncbi:MAG: acyl-phosphate glycerol 3-phosphate acyltransferase [Actinobacteria bacterium]|nr:acyl-phosphate glycerol 3-phosphate acyltransferase [Actinomycetota bacterium]
MLALAYLVGSVPFGVLVARTQQVDLRQNGSGNIGATNVYRVMGKGYGVLVFALDFGKGLGVTVLAMHLFGEPWQHVLVGLTAILGHSFSVFVRFRGGKGVATGIGVIAALSPLTCLIVLSVAALMLKVTRIVSLTSMSGSVLVPVIMYLLDAPLAYVIMTAVIAVLLIIRHKDNIKRLLNGTEHQF